MKYKGNNLIWKESKVNIDTNYIRRHKQLRNCTDMYNYHVYFYLFIF